MINLNNINLLAFFSGIAGIGNIISWVNNLSNDKAQLDNILWELENYKYEIQNYKSEVAQYFDDAKNIIEHPDIIKNEVISKFDQVKSDYEVFLADIRKVKKIKKWFRIKRWFRLLNFKRWLK